MTLNEQKPLDKERKMFYNKCHKGRAVSDDLLGVFALISFNKDKKGKPL